MSAMHTIVLINGREYDITKSEATAIAGRIGMVYIPRLDLTVNMASVAAIEPKGMGKIVDRSKQTEGFLHDGTRMVKQFGQWFLANGATDGSGKLIGKADPDYYPEIRNGILPTIEELKAVSDLPGQEWAKALAGGDTERPQELEAPRTSNLLTESL